MACGPPAGGGGGFCDRPSVPVAKSVAEWKAAPDVTEVFSLDGEDAPTAGVSPEKRTQYRVTSRFVAEVPSGVRCVVARQLDPAYVRAADVVAAVVQVLRG